MFFFVVISGQSFQKWIFQTFSFLCSDMNYIYSTSI